MVSEYREKKKAGLIFKWCSCWCRTCVKIVLVPIHVQEFLERNYSG